MRIVGIVGKAGSGKDSLADFLVRDHGFIKVALADLMKRIASSVYSFTEEQLWGPSEHRNAPDFRYVRSQDAVDAMRREMQRCVDADGVNEEAFQRHQKLAQEHAVKAYLTPRYALQTLGTEWARVCYTNTWVEHLIRTAEHLLNSHVPVSYDRTKGLVFGVGLGQQCPGVVVPDVRFVNEVEAIRKAEGFCCRITRPGAGLKGQAGGHVSETEQDGLADHLFLTEYANDGPLQDLGAYATIIARTMRNRDSEGARAAS